MNDDKKQNNPRNENESVTFNLTAETGARGKSLLFDDEVDKNVFTRPFAAP